MYSLNAPPSKGHICATITANLRASAEPAAQCSLLVGPALPPQNISSLPGALALGICTRQELCDCTEEQSPGTVEHMSIEGRLGSD